METLPAILQNILPSGLISESNSSLASVLGYRSRATIYRIIEGTASVNAVREFCRKLEDSLYLTEDALYIINDTIKNTARLNRLLKLETDNFRKCTPFDILKAFISHDYALFSDDFKSIELPGILRLEQTDPDTFFNMLAYFYFKSLKVDFYTNRETHRERCAEILEPLGKRLIELYPANGIAAKNVFTYSQMSIHDHEAPILWSFITTLATVLQIYGTPNIGLLMAKEMYLVSFLSDRTYLKADNDSDLILMRAVQHNVAGSGYYDIFKINKDNAEVESVGVMTFLSEEIASYRDKLTGDTRLVAYKIDNGSLGFMWANDNESPVWMKNRLKRLSLEHSQSLRSCDMRLSDDMLNEVAMLADGHKLLPDLSVKNVNLSRSGVQISLTNGSIYEISYKQAPFLEYILPSNDVIIAQRLSDDEIFVSWPQLMHCIPLRLFTQIHPS